jgi:spore coat polysaccharide biosynthesis protein SpsF|tara:strand:+ start:716 stop:1144 length:429 start_codon:yes stop_codon:yes gene_type:complete
MNSIAGVIQARMGSSRLPGKSFSKIYKGLSLLEMVILRVMKAKILDMTILTTSKESNCDPLVELADRLGIFTVRGSEIDVLSRFVEAIQQYNPDVIVRVCADNPLTDSGEIGKLVDFSKKANTIMQPITHLSAVYLMDWDVR